MYVYDRRGLACLGLIYPTIKNVNIELIRDSKKVKIEARRRRMRKARRAWSSFEIWSPATYRGEASQWRHIVGIPVKYKGQMALTYVTNVSCASVMAIYDPS